MVSETVLDKEGQIRSFLLCVPDIPPSMIQLIRVKQEGEVLRETTIEIELEGKAVSPVNGELHYRTEDEK